MMLSGSGTANPVATLQPPVTHSQAAAVQDTWYTLLAGPVTNFRIYTWVMLMGTVNETIEFEMTVDGQTLNGSHNATADTEFEVRLVDLTSGNEIMALNPNATNSWRTYLMEGKSLSTVRYRKTSAAGAGTLSSRIIYGRYV